MSLQPKSDFRNGTNTLGFYEEDQAGFSRPSGTQERGGMLVQTLWLRYVQQMTSQEIANKLGISQPVAETWIKTVQRHLDKIDPECF